jgi:hypothetical protein
VRSTAPPPRDQPSPSRQELTAPETSIRLRSPRIHGGTLRRPRSREKHSPRAFVEGETRPSLRSDAPLGPAPCRSEPATWRASYDITVRAPAPRSPLPWLHRRPRRRTSLAVDSNPPSDAPDPSVRPVLRTDPPHHLAARGELPHHRGVAREYRLISSPGRSCRPGRSSCVGVAIGPPESPRWRHLGPSVELPERGARMSPSLGGNLESSRSPRSCRLPRPC